MNAGMFYKGVRFVVSAAVLAAAIPALGMTIGLGDTVTLNQTQSTFAVVGAKIADSKHVTLLLQGDAAAHPRAVTVEGGGTLTDVPGLTVADGPATMDVGLGETVRFADSNTLYRILGVRVAGHTRVALWLEDVNTGAKLIKVVDRRDSLDDVPGVTVFPQGQRGVLPLL